jgi:hypothetical protein
LAVYSRTASPQEMPCYVWACAEEKWDGIDLEYVIEHAMRDCFENASHHLVELESLYDFVSAWNAKQNIITYRPDYGRVIVLDQERFNTLTGRASHESDTYC